MLPNPTHISIDTLLPEAESLANLFPFHLSLSAPAYNRLVTVALWLLSVMPPGSVFSQSKILGLT